jgi:hypothetical protein
MFGIVIGALFFSRLVGMAPGFMPRCPLTTAALKVGEVAHLGPTNCHDAFVHEQGMCIARPSCVNAPQFLCTHFLSRSAICALIFFSTFASNFTQMIAPGGCLYGTGFVSVRAFQTTQANVCR